MLGVPRPGEVLVVDLDDTLIHVDSYTDVGALVRATPIQANVDAVKEWDARGGVVVVATGRSRDQVSEIWECLWRHEIPVTAVHASTEFAGDTALAHYKAGIAEAYGAVALLGDRECDRLAARLAGCRFQWAAPVETPGRVVKEVNQ